MGVKMPEKEAFTVAEGAELTGFSRQTVTRMFEEEKGRSHHGAPGVHTQNTNGAIASERVITQISM